MILSPDEEEELSSGPKDEDKGEMEAQDNDAQSPSDTRLAPSND